MKWIYVLCLVVVAVNQAVRSQPRAGNSPKPPGLPPTVTKRGSRPKDAPPPRITKNNNSAWKGIPPPPGSQNRFNPYNNPSYNQYGSQYQLPYAQQYWQQQQYGPQGGRPGYNQYNQQFNRIPHIKPPPKVDPNINADMYLTLDKHPPILTRSNTPGSGRKISSSKQANKKPKGTTPPPTSPPTGTAPTTYPTDYYDFSSTMSTDAGTTTTEATTTTTRRPTPRRRPTTRRPTRKPTTRAPTTKRRTTTTRPQPTTVKVKTIPNHFGYDNSKPNSAPIPRPPPTWVPFVKSPTTVATVDNGNYNNKAFDISPWNQDPAQTGQSSFNNVATNNNNKQSYQSAKAQITSVNAVQSANKATIDSVALKPMEKPTKEKSWLTGGSTFKSSSTDTRPSSIVGTDNQRTLTSNVAGPAVSATEHIADSKHQNDLAFDYGGQASNTETKVKTSYSQNTMDNGNKADVFVQKQTTSNIKNNAQRKFTRYGKDVLEGRKLSTKSYVEPTLSRADKSSVQNRNYQTSDIKSPIGNGIYSTDTQSKRTLGGLDASRVNEISREFYPSLSRGNGVSLTKSKNLPISETSLLNSRSLSASTQNQDLSTFDRSSVGGSFSAPNENRPFGQKTNFGSFGGTLKSGTQSFELGSQTQSSLDLSMMPDTKSFIGQMSNNNDAFLNFDRTPFDKSTSMLSGSISSTNGKTFSSLDVNGPSSFDISYDRSLINTAGSNDKYMPSNKLTPTLDSTFMSVETGFGTLDKRITTGQQNQNTRDSSLDYMSLDRKKPDNDPTFKTNFKSFQPFDTRRDSGNIDGQPKIKQPFQQQADAFSETAYVKPTLVPAMSIDTNVVKSKPKLDSSAIKELKFRLELEKLIRKRMTNSLTPADQIKLQALKQEYKVWKQLQALEKKMETMKTDPLPKPSPTPGLQIKLDTMINEQPIQRKTMDSKKKTSTLGADIWEIYGKPALLSGDNGKVQQKGFNLQSNTDIKSNGNTNINKDSSTMFDRQQSMSSNKQFGLDQTSNYNTIKQQKGTQLNMKSFSQQYDDLTKIRNIPDLSYKPTNIAMKTSLGNIDDQRTNKLSFQQKSESYVSQQNGGHNQQTKPQFMSQTQGNLKPQVMPSVTQQDTNGYNQQNNQKQQQRGKEYQPTEEIAYKQRSMQQQNTPQGVGTILGLQPSSGQQNVQGPNIPSYAAKQQQQSQYNIPSIGPDSQQSSSQQTFGTATNEQSSFINQNSGLSAAQISKFQQQAIQKQFNQQVKSVPNNQNDNTRISRHRDTNYDLQSFNGQMSNTNNGGQTNNGQRGKTNSGVQTNNGQIGNTNIGGQTNNGQFGNTDIGGQTNNGRWGKTNSGGQTNKGQFGNTKSGGLTNNGHFRNTNIGGQTNNGQFGSTDNGGHSFNGQIGNTDNGRQANNGQWDKTNTDGQSYNGNIGKMASNGQWDKTNTGGLTHNGQIGNANNVGQADNGRWGKASSGGPSYNGQMDNTNNGGQSNNGQWDNMNNRINGQLGKSNTGGHSNNGQMGNANMGSQQYNGHSSNTNNAQSLGSVNNNVQSYNGQNGNNGAQTFNNNNWGMSDSSAQSFSSKDSVDNGASTFTGNNINSGTQASKGLSGYDNNNGNSFRGQISHTDNSVQSSSGLAGSGSPGSRGTGYTQTTVGPGQKKCSITPVCGTDGFTYMSDCFIWPGGAKACDGFCPCDKSSNSTSKASPTRLSLLPVPTNIPTARSQPKMNYIKPTVVPSPVVPSAPIQPARPSPPVKTSPPRCNCPKLYRPVCGIKGTTYTNDCVRRCNYDGFKCQGKCPCGANSLDHQSNTIAARPKIRTTGNKITGLITMKPMSSNRQQGLQYTTKSKPQRGGKGNISYQAPQLVKMSGADNRQLTSDNRVKGTTSDGTPGQTMHIDLVSNRNAGNPGQVIRTNRVQASLNTNTNGIGQNTGTTKQSKPTRLVKGSRPSRRIKQTNTRQTDNRKGHGSRPNKHSKSEQTENNNESSMSQGSRANGYNKQTNSQQTAKPTENSSGNRVSQGSRAYGFNEQTKSVQTENRSGSSFSQGSRPNRFNKQTKSVQTENKSGSSFSQGSRPNRFNKQTISEQTENKSGSSFSPGSRPNRFNKQTKSEQTENRGVTGMRHTNTKVSGRMTYNPNIQRGRSSVINSKKPMSSGQGMQLGRQMSSTLLGKNAGSNRAQIGNVRTIMNNNPISKGQGRQLGRQKSSTSLGNKTGSNRAQTGNGRTIMNNKPIGKGQGKQLGTQKSSTLFGNNAGSERAQIGNGRTKINKKPISTGQRRQLVSKKSSPLYGNNANSKSAQFDGAHSCHCSEVYAPVCGSDGVTYKNPCKQSCSVGIETACTGECPCETVTTNKPTYYCEDFCVRNYEPVCTVSGRTYDNECLRECSMESKACNGECPCGQGVKTRHSQDTRTMYSPPVTDIIPTILPSASSGIWMDPQNFNNEPSNQPLSTCECRPGDIDPVCSITGETLWYGCQAICFNELKGCNGECPCGDGVKTRYVGSA